ncbi:hypothetical protein NCS57_00152500 [Fusarium keratoplasticum]|uniref:Uncharacterized protein n=1 Tax=Fusarium keratoplasticum TaxID=1328300 RepID=A0ACC0RF37_9HYPO|nr:hypothetical protein NCS57_00152500 [Fusarium keratoplasticum]KAI8684853.1 hypothetical protein NCS57_00152500 [Fusarium keratoplasticum]
MSPKGKGHRSHKHKNSSSSSQPQDDEIPIDPNLTDPSYTGYTQDYTQAGPSSYAQWQQQPATVNPNDLLLNQGWSSSSAAQQGYYAAGPAHQDADYDEQAGSSSAAAAQQDYTCEDCGRICHGLRDFNKHAKTHKRPIRCEADENCNETKAEQRDMDRHYVSAHKEFAAWKGILTEPVPCNYPGCSKTFTRQDNLLKHWNKYHLNQ